MFEKRRERSQHWKREVSFGPLTFAQMSDIGVSGNYLKPYKPLVKPFLNVDTLSYITPF